VLGDELPKSRDRLLNPGIGHVRQQTDVLNRQWKVESEAVPSPSNTPGGFELWELRSTKFRVTEIRFS